MLPVFQKLRVCLVRVDDWILAGVGSDSWHEFRVALFVCDGAAFASNSDKNPTLTIMALAWRTGDYIIQQARQGAL